MTEQDPGITGTKLSKSGVEVDARLLARNKSYNKVIDAQAAWLCLRGEDADGEAEALRRWKSKSEWHEKEYGY